jgi:SAM-dependent methyltransferase
MIARIKQYIRRQQYAPGWVGLFLNPFYHSRRGLRIAIRCLAPQMRGNVLDVGCGRKPYQDLFRVTEYVGLEIDTPENRANKSADFYYDGASFPFDTGIYDGAICNQVLEHVFIPDQFLSEIRRVLKPGGKLLLTVPFVWDEHEKPHDYARYTSFGLKSLLRRNGFEMLEHRKINADIRVLFQLTNAYLYKVLWTRWSVVNLLICTILMAPFNILGLVFCKLLPENPDLYLDQVVLVRKPTHE